MAIFNSWLLFLLLITTFLSLIVGWLSHRLISASREKILNQKIRTLRETILEQKEEITQNNQLTVSSAMDGLDGEAENRLTDSLADLQSHNQKLQDSERDLQVKLSQLYTKKQVEISGLKTEMKDLRDRLDSIKGQSTLEERIESPINENEQEWSAETQQDLAANNVADASLLDSVSNSSTTIEIDSQKQTIGRLENQLKIETDVYRRRIDELEEKLEFAQLTKTSGSSKEDKAAIKAVSEQLAEKDAELIAVRNQFDTLQQTVAAAAAKAASADITPAKPIAPSSAEPEPKAVTKATKRKVTKKKAKKKVAKKQPSKKTMSKTAAVVRDDLTRINGIGPKIKELLYKNGVTNFQQIATMKAADVREMADKLGNFRDRIKRDEWVKQAKQLAKK